MKYVLVLMVLLSYQSAFSWFYLNSENKECSDGGQRYNPEGLMAMSERSPSLIKCKKISESKDIVELNCESQMQSLNGKLLFYSTIDLCKKTLVKNK